MNRRNNQLIALKLILFKHFNVAFQKQLGMQQTQPRSNEMMHKIMVASVILTHCEGHYKHTHDSSLENNKGANRAKTS